MKEGKIGDRVFCPVSTGMGKGMESPHFHSISLLLAYTLFTSLLFEEGDGFAVPSDEVQQVIEWDRSLWGKSYSWSLI
jgi:hypothetical protein